MQPQEKQSTREEIKEYKRKCSWSNCNKTSFLEDWKGGKYCFHHIYYIFKNDEHGWFYLKTLKIRNPF